MAIPCPSSAAVPPPAPFALGGEVSLLLFEPHTLSGGPCCRVAPAGTALRDVPLPSQGLLSCACPGLSLGRCWGSPAAFPHLSEHCPGVFPLRDCTGRFGCLLRATGSGPGWAGWLKDKLASAESSSSLCQGWGLVSSSFMKADAKAEAIVTCEGSLGRGRMSSCCMFQGSYYLAAHQLCIDQSWAGSPIPPG